MMKKIAFILCFSLLSYSLYAEDAAMPKRYADMTLPEISQQLKDISTTKMTNEEKIVFFSKGFLNTPYDLKCEGDGPYAEYETMPLINLKQTNCMCYVEIVMAMALSSNYEEMFNVLQHIRYRNGLIGMATRNHYTMADWLPANSWCLRDVTMEVGGDKCKPLTRTISHKAFFASKGITDITNIMPDRTITINYIPNEDLLSVENNLKSGDIVSIIMDQPGIFSAHMGFIIKEDGKTYFRNASSLKMNTVDTPFEDYVDILKRNHKRLGMAFMRIREDVQWELDGKPLHGKIQLSNLK